MIFEDFLLPGQQAAYLNGKYGGGMKMDKTSGREIDKFIFALRTLFDLTKHHKYFKGIYFDKYTFRQNTYF